MLPYNYTLAWNNSSTGQPLMRPIYYYEPDNILVRNYSDEYFWGDALLIAPVLYKGQQEKEIYLPQGVWFNFWNDHRSEGSGTIYEILRLEQIPVYVKAGSFIPMISPIRNTSAYSSKNLTIHYYFDESVQTSSYSMYDDDGKTAGPVEKGFYEILHFTSSTTGNRILFSLNKSGGSYEGMPKERNISFIIHDIQKVPKKVRANGQNITFTWDKTQKQLRFNLTWNMNPTSVEIIMNPFKAIEIKR